ncbi:MAG: fructosamine kinase family protein [Myxococcota bacterium]
MTLNVHVHRAVGEAIGSEIRRAQSLSGGDINEAYALDLDDGRRVFLKTNRTAPVAMFQAEARGLKWLGDAHALRVPEVLAVNGREGPAYLVLELLDPGRPARDFDEQLGRGLATLHRASPGAFGLDHNNFIGSLPQSNTPHESWVEFYESERLRPMIAGYPELHRDFEKLFARMNQLVGPEEAPARLHGDLWGGNLHGSGGAPALIDPAVYGGHREIDLAMMRLFGGFSSRVFDAYEEAYPLAPGANERVPLYQLYPLLVHLNLFGGGYMGSVRQALRRYL